MSIHTRTRALEVRDRPTLSGERATALAALFDVLANDTRLRLLHALVRADELCVSDLADEVEASIQAVSNQLARLAALRIVASRRDGNRMLYRVVDPCVAILLDRGLCIAEDAGCAADGVKYARSAATRR